MISESMPNWPCFEQDEIDAVADVLSSGRVNYWTGDHGRLFEEEFAEYVGVKHAVALANGTVALEAALLALGVGDGDDVIVPSRTFIATASSVVMRGARPVVADIDAVSGNITVETIRQVMTPETKAIIVVHMSGWPCDMKPIIGFAKKQGLKVIEDCAQAHGAEYHGQKVGSFGDVAAFSFCQDKIMTTGGEGGMLVTDSEAVWKRAWAFKDHGKSFDTVFNQQHPPGFRWLHESFGTNWRMTEMQSVLGRIQLKKLDGWVEKRRQNAALLNVGLKDVKGLTVPVPAEGVCSSYYRFTLFADKKQLNSGWDRDRIVDAINRDGVPCFQGACTEIYREKSFQVNGMAPAEPLSVAREFGESNFCLLVHPTLNDDDMSHAVEVVKSVMAAASV